MLKDLRRLLRAYRAPQQPARCEPLAAPPPRDAHGRPLVSIVTIVLNRRGSLPRTIDSVRAQTYPNIEYIVLDGGSTDGTVDVIKSNLDRIDRWRSARDGGLYEALNEGVRQARGEFVQFVHSDDWLEPRQIEHAVEMATVSHADFVHGDLMLHLETGESVRVPGAQDWATLRPREFPAIRHPTVLARRSLYERIGLFRTDMRIASDFDWLWRAARAGAVAVYDPRVMSHMAEGGVSTKRQKLCLSEYVVLTATLPDIPRGICRGYAYLLVTNGMPFALVRRPMAIARAAARRAVSLVRRALSLAWRMLRRALSLAKRLLRACVVGTPLESPARRAWQRLRGVPPEPAPAVVEFPMLAAFARARDAGTALGDADVLRIIELSRGKRSARVHGSDEAVAHARAALAEAGCALAATDDAHADLELMLEPDAAGSVRVRVVR